MNIFGDQVELMYRVMPGAPDLQKTVTVTETAMNDSKKYRLAK